MKKEEVLVPGKRYAVFAIRSKKNGESIWVRAGVAFVQPDDSMNLTLDVLPLDGQLHIRESTPKHVQHGGHHTVQHTNPNQNQNQKPREEPATPGFAPTQSVGGH
jgi:hypothetical protein